MEGGGAGELGGLRPHAGHCMPFRPHLSVAMRSEEHPYLGPWMLRAALAPARLSWGLWEVAADPAVVCGGGSRCLLKPKLIEFYSIFSRLPCPY